MKKEGLALFALVLLTTLSFNCENCDENTKKYIIIHKGKEIKISVNAWDAHAAHGDEWIDCVPTN